MPYTPSSFSSSLAGSIRIRSTCGKAFNFAGALLMAILRAVFGAALGGGTANAQTAHYSGAVSTLGSGTLHTFGVAVDGNANVFVANSANNAVIDTRSVDFGPMAAAAATPHRQVSRKFKFKSEIQAHPSGEWK